MLKGDDMVVDNIEILVVYQIVAYGEGDLLAPEFEVTEETLTFVDIQVGELLQIELPKVLTYPEGTEIAYYGADLGDAANFASFDSESGLLEIEEGHTDADSVGQHLL